MGGRGVAATTLVQGRAGTVTGGHTTLRDHALKVIEVIDLILDCTPPDKKALETQAYIS